MGKRGEHHCDFLRYSRIILLSSSFSRAHRFLKEKRVDQWNCPVKKVEIYNQEELVVEVVNIQGLKLKSSSQILKKILFFYYWKKMIKASCFQKHKNSRNLYQLYLDFIEAIELLNRKKLESLKTFEELRNLEKMIGDCYEKNHLWNKTEIDNLRKKQRIPQEWLIICPWEDPLIEGGTVWKRDLFKKRKRSCGERKQIQCESPVEEVKQLSYFLKKHPHKWSEIEILYCDKRYKRALLRKLDVVKVPYITTEMTKLIEVELFGYMMKWLQFYAKGCLMKNFIELKEEGYISIRRSLMKNLWKNEENLWMSLLQHKEGLWFWWVQTVESKIQSQKVRREWESWKEEIVGVFRIGKVVHYCYGEKGQIILKSQQMKEVIKKILKRGVKQGISKKEEVYINQVINMWPENLEQSFDDYIEYLEAFVAQQEVGNMPHIQQGRVLISPWNQPYNYRSSVYVLGMTRRFLNQKKVSNIYFSNEEYEHYQKKEVKSRRKKMFMDLYYYHQGSVYFSYNCQEEENQVPAELKECQLIKKETLLGQSHKIDKEKKEQQRSDLEVEKKGLDILVLSPSRVVQFKECSYRFFLERELEIYSYEVMRERWVNPMYKGTLIHRILEDIFSSKKGAIEKEKIIKGHITRWLIHNPHRYKMYREGLKKEIKKIVSQLYLNSQPHESVRKLICERKVQFKEVIKEVTILWKCQIDRMDIYKDKIEVIDYKTGRSPKVKGKGINSQDLQVYLYLWILTHKEREAQEYQNKKWKGKLVYSDRVVELDWTEERKREIQTYLEDFVQLVSATKKSKKRMLCSYCPYPHICELNEERG